MIIQKLKNFKGVSTLKKVALNLFVKMLNNKDIEKLKGYFKLLDKDGTGMVRRPELKEAIRQANLSISDEDIT